jgi:hypothetical protein
MNAVPSNVKPNIINQTYNKSLYLLDRVQYLNQFFLILDHKINLENHVSNQYAKMVQDLEKL